MTPPWGVARSDGEADAAVEAAVTVRVNMEETVVDIVVVRCAEAPANSSQACWRALSYPPRKCRQGGVLVNYVVKQRLAAT